VAQAGERAELVAETLERVPFERGGAQDLEGDGAAGLVPVVGEEHFPHPALAQPAHDLPPPVQQQLESHQKVGWKLHPFRGGRKGQNERRFPDAAAGDATS
jgi:hypothetical protein